MDLSIWSVLKFWLLNLIKRYPEGKRIKTHHHAWLVGWVIVIFGWLVVWLVWLVGCLVGWVILIFGCLVGWLAGVLPLVEAGYENHAYARVCGKSFASKSGFVAKSLCTIMCTMWNLKTSIYEWLNQLTIPNITMTIRFKLVVYWHCSRNPSQIF